MYHVNDFINQKHENMTKNERSYSVYMHKCPNGMIYVGLTSVAPYRRWQQGNGYRDNKLFYPLIEEYGWNNIEHITVATGLTRTEGEWLERRLIQLTDRNYSLNTVKAHKSKYGLNDLVELDDNLVKPNYQISNLDEFYGDAINHNVHRSIFGVSLNEWITTHTQTSKPTSLTFGSIETPITKTNSNMKKAKKETKRSCKIASVKIELMFDNRYKKGDGSYPVCVRVYNDKKYVYLQTGYSMTPAEFDCMDAKNETSLNKMYERVCDYVREKTDGCSFCIDCVKADIEKKMQGITSTSGTLASLVMEKAALLTNSGSATNYRSAMLRVLKTHPNGLPLAMVNQHTIGEVLSDLRKDGYTDTTINIYLSVIKASINYGIYKGYLKPEQYPFKRQAMEVDKVVVPKSVKRDDRYITKDEMRQLWGWFTQTKNKWVGYFLFSYLHGGMNLADMMDLRFNDFWFTEGGFVFTRKKTAHKTNHRVLVPATTWTTELFNTMDITPTKGERVFGGLAYDGTDASYQKVKSKFDTKINRALDKACAELGIDKNVSMTTARHTFATVATKERLPFAMIEGAMGHVLGGVSSHYIGGFTISEMRPDLEKLL